MSSKLTRHAEKFKDAPNKDAKLFVDFGDANETTLNTLSLRDVSAAPRDLMERWLNRVHCGNCVALMDAMPSESVDLIVTSPPYNLRNSTGNGMKNGSGGKWEKAKLMEGYETHTDDMPHDEYVKWQRRCLTSMMRVIKDDGAIFYNHKWRVQGGILQDRQDIVGSFPVRQIIIWM